MAVEKETSLVVHWENDLEMMMVESLVASSVQMLVEHLALKKAVGMVGMWELDLAENLAYYSAEGLVLSKAIYLVMQRAASLDDLMGLS